MKPKKVIIIGAGPAGLTATFELLKHPEFTPIIFETENQVGGISKTVNYHGYRIDIGGHRFFSKSNLIKNWWLNFLPAINNPAEAETKNKVMLTRNRLSRIYFKNKFFDYPISLNKNTLDNLGWFYSFKIFLSYLKAKLFPIKPEKSLEDFFTNRFGSELYGTFFKDYTEKLWGMPCSQIPPEWGAQRIKSLSLIKTVLHAIKKIFIKNTTVEQKNTETSLIEKFFYPKFGPGQLWEEVAKQIQKKGGQINLNQQVIGLNFLSTSTIEVKIKNQITSKITTETADFVISSMPIKDLVNTFNPPVPKEIINTANDLKYRDFITVGLLLNKVEFGKQDSRPIKDTWIYLQEPGIKMTRIQIFNNWSPYLLADQNKIWLGLEYVCHEEDEIWQADDKTIIELAISELEKIGVAKKDDLLDQTVIRVKKAYPAYFGGYKNLGIVKDYLNKIPNLFLIGRNGLHRYNNMDHSMFTAIEAVKNIINGQTNKDNIWQINNQDEYHESAEKKSL